MSSMEFPFLKGRFKSVVHVQLGPAAQLVFPFLKGRFKSIAMSSGPAPSSSGFHSSKEDSRGKAPPSAIFWADRVSIPQRKIQEAPDGLLQRDGAERFHSSKEDSRGGRPCRAFLMPSPFPFLKGRFKRLFRGIISGGE